MMTLRRPAIGCWSIYASNKTQVVSPPSGSAGKCDDRHSTPLAFCSLFVHDDRHHLIGRQCPILSLFAEIERVRAQVGRQRKEILQLQRAEVSTASAETLLQRMLDKLDTLCAERDRLKKDVPGPTKGRVLGGRQW